MLIVQRIFDREALSNGSSQQVAVGGDEGKNRQGLRLHDLVGIQSCGQLDGIIRPQAVTLSQLDGTVDDRTAYVKECEVVFAVLQETAQDTISLILSDPFRSPVLSVRARINAHSNGHFLLYEA